MADHLRSWSDDDVAALIAARPDLMHPIPADIAELASRSASAHSTSLAVNRLDALHRQLLEGLAALGGESGAVVTRAALLAGLGSPAGEQVLALDGAMSELQSLALVWTQGDDWRLVATVAEGFGPFPCGLDRSDRSARPRIRGYLADPESLEAELAPAPAAAREVIDRLLWGPPAGSLPRADREISEAEATSPVEWLLARDLLVSTSPTRVVLPREVALILRRGRLVRHVDWEPDPGPAGPEPLAGTALYAAESVERASGFHALTAVRSMVDLLGYVDSHEPGVLRNGGLGQREFRAMTTALQRPPDVVGLHAESARRAGLIAADAETGRWGVTQQADVWLRLPEAEQWAIIAAGWWHGPVMGSWGGSPDQSGRARPLLSDDAATGPELEVRRASIQAAALVEGRRPLSVPPLSQWVLWRRPRIDETGVPAMVGAVLHEAELLGITGNGVLAMVGRELTEHGHLGADDLAPVLADAIRSTLPALVGEVILQGDLTATAPGPLNRDLAERLALLADRESDGIGAVYRFTPASVRRALDTGLAAADMVDFLQQHTRTGVPHAIETLIRDEGRRYGRISVSREATVLRSDDDETLSALLADRDLQHLNLRRLGSGVLASSRSAEEVSTALRKVGQSPSLDGHTSTKRRRRRVAVPAPTTVTHPGPDVIAAAVRALRAGERANASAPGAAGRPPLQPLGPSDLSQMLADAARDGQGVWIDYADQTGSRGVRMVEPLTLRSGSLAAFDHREQRVRSFSLSRIAAAARAETMAG